MSCLFGVIIDVQKCGSEQKNRSSYVLKIKFYQPKQDKKNREKKCNKRAIISVVKLYFWYNLFVCKEKEINKKIINLSLV